jgi:DNA ligase (NAD+)
MVLKSDDMSLWHELGTTEHHPRYAIAYKFPAKQVRTRVTSIDHSVGRTGTVTPVANLEAVDVWGVVVRRATLHNYDELAKKGVRVGDYVFIMRAGEVIPEIVSVITEVRDGSEEVINPPDICPACSTKLEKDEGKIAIYCPNTHCPAKIQWQLEMFVGKQWFNIDGLWVKQIELLLNLGWVTDFVSVFQLARYRERFLDLEWYQEKSVNNLLEAIEKARHTTLDRALVAVGIPNVGKKTARSLAKVILNKSHLSEVISTQDSKIIKYSLLQASQLYNQSSSWIVWNIFSLTEEELIEVDDIGPETAMSFVEYMWVNRELIERLIAELDIVRPERGFFVLQDDGKSESKIFWKSFCVTGSFDDISRDQVHELIEKNGGEVRTAVTGKLDYLIVWTDAGSKKTKAESLGVKCIDIGELKLLFSNPRIR